MAEIELSGSGLENLAKFAEELPEKLAQALAQACVYVQDSAKENCPVDSGQLRNSIAYSVDEDSLTGQVGTNVEYAPYVEMGTGIYADGGRQTPWCYMGRDGQFHWTSGHPAQPFLAPALEENKENILNCFKGLV